MNDSRVVVAAIDRESEFPPVLVGNSTPLVERHVRSFYESIADLFERWVARRVSPHSQRAYRQGVMDFVRFMHIDWPRETTRLLTVRGADVQDYRDSLEQCGYAPKTLNHRTLAVAAFYKYLREAANELRLLISVPNPAHSQFIAREAATLWTRHGRFLCLTRGICDRCLLVTRCLRFVGGPQPAFTCNHVFQKEENRLCVLVEIMDARPAEWVALAQRMPSQKFKTLPCQV